MERAIYTQKKINQIIKDLSTKVSGMEQEIDSNESKIQRKQSSVNRLSRSVGELQQALNSMQLEVSMKKALRSEISKYEVSQKKKEVPKKRIRIRHHPKKTRPARKPFKIETRIPAEVSSDGKETEAVVEKTIQESKKEKGFQKTQGSQKAREEGSQAKSQEKTS